MFAIPASLSGGKIVRFGREKFVDRGSQISGVINGRIPVQGNGSDMSKLLEVIETIDLRALGDVA